MEASKRIGDYEILNKLGSGGMGAVYRVRNVISDRIEAMKVLLPDLVDRQDLVARFLREIKVLAGLHHPNIAALRTAQTVDNQFVMIMELVDGQSLAQRISKQALTPTEALHVVKQVLDALDYAHQQGVIHRDIKPANMMITPQGVIKLTDFGIARSTRDQTLTAAGVTTGSLSYMSPEQINGGTPDARSDLYSLGVSLYEMVTGQVPFKADTEVAVMFAHLQKAPVPPIDLQPALSPELNAVVLKAIAKDPGSRFQTAAEFRDAVIAATRGIAPVDHREAATVLAMPSLPPTAPIIVPPSGPVSGSHAATVVATPSIAHSAPPPVPAMPAAAVPPSPPPAVPQPVMAAAAVPGPVPSARRVQGGVSPILYVALGAFLVVGAIAAMAYYARRAEATPPANSTTALPAASTPTPSPASDTPSAPAASSSPAASADAPASAATSPAPVESPSVAAPASGTTAASATTSPGASSSGVAASLAPGATSTPARLPASVATADRPAREPRPAGDPTPAVAPPTTPAARANAEAAQLEEALDRLETEIDQLTARVEAVNGTIDRLKAEQARAGYGLRGDMAARQSSMNSNLRKAAEAAERKDVARADRFKSLAQTDLEVLEKFIGR